MNNLTPEKSLNGEEIVKPEKPIVPQPKIPEVKPPISHQQPITTHPEAAKPDVNTIIETSQPEIQTTTINPGSPEEKIGDIFNGSKKIDGVVDADEATRIVSDLQEQQK